MDATTASGGKAVLPAGSDAAAPSSGRVERQTPLSDDAAAAAVDAPVAAGAEGGGGSAGGEEDDDDEQVERFYALLANIRALRGAHRAADTDGAETDGGCGARKRVRSADPPWRPAFRLEDFEEASPTTDDARRAKTRRRNEADGEESGARPVLALASANVVAPAARGCTARQPQQ
ncbi:NRR repressor homolog 1-like [Phragmites australis]|uniref:NRR repressor homolog 1-like n=1 Tax=Phragmites australis TaxID=29695 RepID=UPI002D79B265|nr:NRR repressor homolog 1-like [Phragmites australis]